MAKIIEAPTAEEKKKGNERTCECVFCGQQRLIGMKMAEWEALEETAAPYGMTAEDYAATMKCDCRAGEALRNTATITRKAKDNIAMMFEGEHEEIANVFREAIPEILGKDFKKIIIQDYKGGKATMSLQKGLIRLEYEQKKKTELTSE